jgi:hypothetical protein
VLVRLLEPMFISGVPYAVGDAVQVPRSLAAELIGKGRATAAERPHVEAETLETPETETLPRASGRKRVRSSGGEQGNAD